MINDIGYRSLIYRALVAWEDNHIKNGTHGRIDDVNLNNKVFLHRIARNYVRHTMVPEYYKRLKKAISADEVKQIKRDIDREIFKIYPELREGYNYKRGDYRR